MITAATSVPSTLFGIAGHAPASPQSARGESVNSEGLRPELVAASQANTPLYDQKAQLTDQHIAARSQAGEQAVRQQPVQTSATDHDNAATEQSGKLLLSQSGELPSHMRIEHGSDAAADFRNQENDNESRNGWTQHRAMQAYGNAQQTAPQSGEFLSLAL